MTASFPKENYDVARKFTMLWINTRNRHDNWPLLSSRYPGLTLRYPSLIQPQQQTHKVIPCLSCTPMWLGGPAKCFCHLRGSPVPSLTTSYTANHHVSRMGNLHFSSEPSFPPPLQKLCPEYLISPCTKHHQKGTCEWESSALGKQHPYISACTPHPPERPQCLALDTNTSKVTSKMTSLGEKYLRTLLVVLA